MPRILIDCSLARFDLQPTGIPRVVLNYARYGRDYGREIGIEVVPVRRLPHGHFREFELPAYNKVLPRKKVPIRAGALLVTIAAKILLELARYFVRIAIATLALAVAILPARGLIRFARRLSCRLRAAKSGWRARVERRKSGTDASVGTGDVVLCPGYWHDIEPSFYEGLHATGAEIAFVLHDILPVLYPAHYAYPWRWKFEQRLIRSLDYVGHYYCVSNATRMNLIEFAARHGKTVSASVAYDGFEPVTGSATVTASSAHAALLRRRPWLMVGTLEPKKGYVEALAAFAKLWEAGYRRPLVVIGRPGWVCDDIVESFQTSPWAGEHFFWLDRVDDTVLSCFYRGAHALLFASHAEGFGLPLLEAASHGLAILARDAPTPREVLGSDGLYFTNRDDLAASITTLEDPVRLDAARATIARLTWFDWRTVVRSVIDDLVRPSAQRRAGTELLPPDLRRPVFRDAHPPAAAYAVRPNPDAATQSNNAAALISAGQNG